MKNLSDFELNLLDSIENAEKGVNKILFSLLTLVGLVLYAKITTSSGLTLLGFNFEKSEIGLFYLIIGVSIIILIGITGIRITNYIIKRFLYDTINYSLNKEERRLRFELINHSVFEITYNSLLGKKFRQKKVKFSLRNLTSLGFLSLIMVAHTIGIISITFAFWYKGDALFISAILSTVIFLPISIGVWIAFYFTINRRSEQFKKNTSLLKKKFQVNRK